MRTPRIGSVYELSPVGLFDVASARVRPYIGKKVRVVQPHGCPRNGTFGHCYVETAADGDDPGGEFIGLVLASSLENLKDPQRCCLRCGKDLSDESGVYVFVQGKCAPDRTVRGGSGPQVLLCVAHGSNGANNLSLDEFERLYRERYGRDPQSL